jgi:hypothetical protein
VLVATENTLRVGVELLGGEQVSEPAYSATVCSGDLKPHTSVSLEAPYDPGAIQKLCSGSADSLGIRSVDWDLCTFDLEPVKAP